MQSNEIIRAKQKIQALVNNQEDLILTTGVTCEIIHIVLALLTLSLTHSLVSLLFLVGAVVVVAVTAFVGLISRRSSTIVVVLVGITVVDDKAELFACVGDGTVEVFHRDESVVLCYGEHVLQFGVASCPVHSVEVACHFHVHDVVEVDFVGSVILVVGESQFIGHFVGQEQGLVTCLAVTHGVCVCQHCHDSDEGNC